MNTLQRLARQATAFGLAAVVTLSILGSIDLLAVQPAGAALIAGASSAPSRG